MFLLLFNKVFTGVDLKLVMAKAVPMLMYDIEKQPVVGTSNPDDAKITLADKKIIEYLGGSIVRWLRKQCKSPDCAEK